jgi:hypothetical protein
MSTDATPATPQQIEDAQRKLRKFLLRSAPGLGQPIIELRDEATGHLTMTLHWERADAQSNWYVTRLDRPSLDKRMIDSIIVECRVFFAQQEDCYLPGIVSALQRLVTPERGRELRATLKPHVAQVVKDGRLVSPPGGASMYSGRLEMDNGYGPGRLLSNDEVAMDYIYGVALHEDDAALARLSNLDEESDSALLAVVLTIDNLLHIITNVRRQILHDIDKGYIAL